MTFYSVRCNSYLGSDTRIQVVKQGNAKKESYLDRDSKSETNRSIGFSESELSSSPARKAKRVRHSRLSPYAKASLQRVGGAVSAHYDACKSVFLTGTFPTGTFRGQSAVATQSAWIVHRLKSWLYKRIGSNVGYYAWEFQKRGTLHLHYVVLVPCPKLRAAIIADFRDEWIRLIAGASARSNENLFVGNRGRDFFTEKEKLQIYAKECYKCAASYLSKYLSKHKYSDYPPPTRMWGMTKQARHLVASSLISVEICHKTITQAEEIAFRMESESDTPQEKTRFFRHRFSLGFTILLYNDAYRMELSKMQKDRLKSGVTPYAQKAKFLKQAIDKALILPKIRCGVTPSAWVSFLSLVSPENEYAVDFNAQNVAESLIEVQWVVENCGVGGFRTRSDIKNKIAVILLEIIKTYGLSVLQSPYASVVEMDKQDQPNNELESVQVPIQQLLL